MKTRSYVSCTPPCARSAASASARRTCARGAREPERGEVGPQRAQRERVALDEHGAARRRARAPRCPSAPLPANRSSTRAPATLAEHREQRLAHAIGGRPRDAPAGARMRLPPSSPAITRMRAVTPAHPPGPEAIALERARSRSGGDRLERLGAEARRAARRRAARARARAARGPRAMIASARARARSSSAASSGSCATLNWRRPDWRVPTSSPSLRSSQVDLGQRESRRSARPARAAAASPAAPSAGSWRGARRARCARAAGAAGRCRSARRSRRASRSRWARRCPPRSPSWRRARRPRRRRRPPSPAASRAGACRRAAARAGGRAARPCAGARARRSPRAGRRSRRAPPARAPPAGCSSISGHTTNAWRPARSCSRSSLVGAGARALAGDDARVDRLAPARQLAQRARVEVAVAGQRERARDRRRGHVQRVRRRPWRAARARWRTPKRCCSSTTATASDAKAHVGLDQRVRADDQRAARRSRACRACRARRRAGVEPVSSAQRDRLAAEQLLDRREVLFGERLGRRHQRRLAAVLDRAQHRVQRDDRLAAADLAHQQALHRARRRASSASISAIARAGRRSARTAGRARASARSAAAARASACAGSCSRGARAGAGTRSCVEQQLLEGQALAPVLAVARAAREVHRRERARAVGQALGRAQSRRQRLDARRRALATLLHEREDLRRADALAGGVVGDRRRPPGAGARRRPGYRRASSVARVGSARQRAPIAWWETRKPPRSSALPCSTSRVPGR